MRNGRSETFFHQLRPVVSGTNVVVPVEEADRAHIIESPQVFESFNELAPQPSLLEGGEAKLFESILVAAVAQLRDELGRTMLDAFQLRFVPLMCGDQNWTACSRWGRTRDL